MDINKLIDKKTVKRLSYFLMFLTIPVFLYIRGEQNEKYDQEYSTYSDICLQKKGYKGKIIICRLSRYLRGQTLIVLTNRDRFRISCGTYNFLYEEPEISRFLKANDSIYKPAQKDSLYIYRDSIKYYFVLGESLNKELKK